VTAIDGDDFWGERCELGRNNQTYGENAPGQTSGMFPLYRDGERRITFFSERYPASIPMGVAAWQAIAQMKQSQPADNAGQGPVLDLELWGGRLQLHDSWQERWTTSAPAQNTWIRYALDNVYSANPAVGSVKVYVDLNGDSDALDSGEQSPTLNMQTL
jgi:hypothetical protein